MMEFGDEFEYDQFWPNQYKQKRKRKKEKKYKHDDV
jgi:hypothetical protein